MQNQPHECTLAANAQNGTENRRWTPPLEAYEPEIQSTVINIAKLQQAAKEAKK